MLIDLLNKVFHGNHIKKNAYIHLYTVMVFRQKTKFHKGIFLKNVFIHIQLLTEIFCLFEIY